ncbi:basic amino acid ABC transporter substrate-binding protein [Kingella kingae]|uniref:Glutamine ABC superfamily ATP binding cassette transporter, binding protein n=3 Tax=Kingella kingae TaxID=504 RepID=F5S6I6_KINKI|nr:basic amino acid ABC transporter substrate-binding protein [Kingella kingae]EGK09962.1 glutamine ABC superfamily ATP binding cassette transporter, binding protein [Kingella kingae ATCC 23330]MDK4535226.1 basic amino acid ABC transporter substrate-binding protein [Kingella kingae]MDK4541724.1 basic amino acid ABC transporter substrate-binding protein [Kingella kingae]MDK4554251.1 basic amino acid ABC transporter substrate-binding protein [Kingella kingae]UOP02395.1 basic amino acid ABC trans
MLAKSKVLFSSTILSMCLLAACSGGNNAPAASQNTDAASSAAPAASLDLNKTYIVATDATYAPMEYMENEKVVGFSHDVLDAAAKSQNVKLEFVNTPFKGLFANVDKGDSDIGLASITISDERKQQLDFSEPYFEATQMIVVTDRNINAVKSFADLKTRSASVQAATSGDLILQDLQGKDSQNIKRFETMPLAFKELESGGVDAVVGDSSVVGYYVSQNPNAKLHTLVDPSFVSEQYGFAFKKGRNDGLREVINKGLSQIKTNGTYDKIHTQWFGAPANASTAASAASAQ